jgi:hypothetical protein
MGRRGHHRRHHAIDRLAAALGARFFCRVVRKQLGLTVPVIR